MTKHTPSARSARTARLDGWIGAPATRLGAPVRDWVAFTARQPEPTRIATMLGVLVCSVYQAFLASALLGGVLAGGANGNARAGRMAGVGGDGGSALVWGDLVTTPWGATAVVAVVLGAALLLILSARFPLGVLVASCAVLVAAASVSLHDAVLFPMLFAAFAAVFRLGFARLLVALGVAVGAVTMAAALVSLPGGFAEELLGQASTVLLAVAVAVAARSVGGWRRSRQQAETAVLESRALRQERDEATTRGRIAAELHDSVGQKLTSIIALSEGLLGTGADAELEAALRGINSVARESLDETRRAVRELGACTLPPGAVMPRERDWGDVAVVLDEARFAGLDVSFSASGHARPDPRQAGLCFAVTREALTNALRHGGSGGSARVALVHARDGGVRVTVRHAHRPGARADTASGTQTAAAPGTGLRRLAAVLDRPGGGFEFGWERAGVWKVTALVPPSMEACPVAAESGRKYGSRIRHDCEVDP